MSRSKDFLMWQEEKIREQYGIPDDQEIELEDYLPDFSPPGQVHDFFADELQGNIERRPLDDYRWDVFMSYASERRAEFVTPLVGELRRLGVTVWFDQDQISWLPDQGINPAIPRVRVGVVVFSSEYLLKEWTLYELRGLVSAGLRSMVVVSYQLGVEQEEIVARWADSLSVLNVELTLVTLRSSKVRGAALRIRAAVRRVSQRPRLNQRARAGWTMVAELTAAHERTLPRGSEGLERHIRKILISPSNPSPSPSDVQRMVKNLDPVFARGRYPMSVEDYES